MKRILSFFFVLMLCLGTFNIHSYAYEQAALSPPEFTRLQKESLIDNRISYEMWLQIVKENDHLEQALDENENFKKVYDGVPYALTSAEIESGDVIITNSTSSFGLTGHAAIAIDSNEILDIPRPKEPVRTQTVSKFKNEYKKGWIKVYRPQNSSWGSAAAKWASETYKGSNAVYKITLDVNSTNETYCSKIVFQAYKFGVGEEAFKDYYHTQGDFTGNDYNINYVIILPYGLPTSLDVDYTNKL